MKTMRFSREGCLRALALSLIAAFAASTVGAAELPQKHEYQRQLRAYLGSLKESDFETGVSEKLGAVPGSDDPDYQLRNYCLTLMLQPLVGTKRAAPSVATPASQFTLATLESGEEVLTPPVF